MFPNYRDRDHSGALQPHPVAVSSTLANHCSNHLEKGSVGSLLLRKFLLITTIMFLGIMSLPFVKSFYDKITQDEMASNMIPMQPGDMVLPKLVLIPAGSFDMGEQDTAFIKNLNTDEKKYFGVPGIHVEINEPFYLSKYEITNEHYDYYVRAQQLSNRMENTSVMPSGANKGGHGSQPVVEISWRRAMAYAIWLGEQKQLSCRLPTEAEWEYAARAGQKTAYPWGEELGVNNANCDGCGSQWDNHQAAPVGQFKANLYGLYDMSGNVWEWTCSAWSDQYDGQEQQCVSMEDFNPRVVRGGSWAYGPKYMRSAVRGEFDPGIRYNGFGFRVMCMLPIE